MKNLQKTSVEGTNERSRRQSLPTYTKDQIELYCLYLDHIFN